MFDSGWVDRSCRKAGVSNSGAFIQQTLIKLLYGFPLSTHLLSTETDPGFYSGGAIDHPRDYISPVSLECKQLSRSAVCIFWESFLCETGSAEQG